MQLAETVIEFSDETALSAVQRKQTWKTATIDYSHNCALSRLLNAKMVGNCPITTMRNLTESNKTTNQKLEGSRPSTQSFENNQKQHDYYQK